VVTPGDGLLQEGEELSSLPLPHQEGPHLLPLCAAALHMEALHKETVFRDVLNWLTMIRRAFLHFIYYYKIHQLKIKLTKTYSGIWTRQYFFVQGKRKKKK
jgi:hypothetical protein